MAFWDILSQNRSRHSIMMLPTYFTLSPLMPSIARFSFAEGSVVKRRSDR